MSYLRSEGAFGSFFRFEKHDPVIEIVLVLHEGGRIVPGALEDLEIVDQIGVGEIREAALLDPGDLAWTP